MKTQQKLGEYLHFTRKDRIAIIVIAFILLTAFLLPSVMENTISPTPPPADTAWMAAIHQLEKLAPYAKKSDGYNMQEGSKTDENKARDRTADKYNNIIRDELFVFDPNTLDSAGWKRLGIREKTITTILKYRGKGGRFRKPEDLQRIYGLPPALLERLMSYIKIEGKADSPPLDRSVAGKPGPLTDNRYVTININTADSSAFEHLPGIGPTLAMRIIRFRDKLGGFYHMEQLKETFGLADSVFQKIRPYLKSEDQVLKRMDLNKAGIDELKAHPYIRYNIANAIIQYRNQHGLFVTVEDLKKLVLIDNAVYEKLKPYLFISQ